MAPITANKSPQSASPPIAKSPNNCTFLHATINLGTPLIFNHASRVSTHETTHTLCRSIKLNISYSTVLLSQNNSLIFPDLIFSSFDILVMCEYIEFNIQDSLIKGRRLHIMPGHAGGFFRMNNVTFDGHNAIGSLGGVSFSTHFLSGMQTSAKFQIKIFNSLFQYNCMADMFLLGLFNHMGISSAALYFYMLGDTHFQIHRTTFSNNERALGVDMYKGNIIITECTFLNNTSMFDGGAIKVTKWLPNFLTIHINSNTFQSNRAGLNVVMLKWFGVKGYSTSDTVQYKFYYKLGELTFEHEFNISY